VEEIMTRLVLRAGCVLAVLLLVCATARAEEAPPPPRWFDLIELDAFASVGYVWNFNRPPSNTNQYRVFDFTHNSFKIDAGQLILQKQAVKPGDLGFRIDFVAGSSVPRVTAARGLFRDPTTGVAQDFDLQQAFGSYIFPLGHGLRLDIGKFATPVGYETMDGYGAYNDNYSRSLLFGFGPYTHTGFKLSYQINERVAVMVMLVNGWDNVLDNNQGKSIGMQVVANPTDKILLQLLYLVGPERDNNDDDMRHFIDLIAQYKPHWRATIGFNGVLGVDVNAVNVSTLPGQMKTDDALWLGGALYLRLVALRNRLAFSFRGEIVWDRDGNRSGTAQTLYEFTFTPEVAVTQKFLIRPEFRIDSSNQHPFETGDTQGGQPIKRGYQPTLAINAIYLVP
jgi:hypothetical protein